MELHERVLNLRIATHRHPSNMLDGGTVFPPVEDITLESILNDMETESNS
ncbi:MAG: hypothetical protein NC114_10580 [Ruminococcus flavefaciens]|nr:hypothetical protein [Ruminococcus flavefaciens]